MAGRADSRADSGAKPDGGTERLVAGCLACLEQCGDLLRDMPGVVFTASGGGNSPIGTHVRHIIDRYRCFFEGLSQARINYDDRRRGTPVETGPKAALAAIADTRNRLDRFDPAPHSRKVQVCELVHHDGVAASVESTIDRELMGLISHSIHHIAIIAMLARSHGHPVPEHLGKAPSTPAATPPPRRGTLP